MECERKYNKRILTTKKEEVEKPSYDPFAGQHKNDSILIASGGKNEEKVYLFLELSTAILCTIQINL